MNPKPKLLYLIGQFPAINHGYLLAEIRLLRSFGFDLHVISTSPPDRPMEKLSEPEREEASRTYYVKSLSALRIFFLNVLEFLRSPFRYLGGFFFTVGLATVEVQKLFHHLAYFAQAAVVGRRMRELGLTHLHANFSTVALIAAKLFPITWSFGVYGFGELHDPTASHLSERIHSAKFARSISRFGRGQMMLSCERSQWSKLLYCPLGIDAADFPPPLPTSTSCALSLLCVGRLAEEKGQALLLESISVLSGQGIPVQLHLVGDGPDRTWLERYAKQLGISSNVVFEGWVDQDRLLALYASSDAFVLSSLAEGIPMVLMEAMILGKPCVAPRIAGIPELIEDGVDGLLFTVADVGELTKKIQALRSVELRQGLGARAREKVLRDYDMARNTARFAAMLEKQLESIANQRTAD